MMWFSVILGLLFLIIPLAYLLASLVGLSYLWYRVFKGRSGGDLPTCAKCGYAVRGLVGLNCPECGADLREVGIVTPKQRGAVSPVMFVLLWTLLLPGPSCLVSGLLSAMGPKTSVPNGSLVLTPVTSSQYLTATIEQMKYFAFGNANNTTITIEGNNSQYEYLEIDPVAMTYEDWSKLTTPSQSSPSGSINMAATTKPLDRQAVLDLLKSAGADITRQDVMDEADEMLSIIQGISTQGLANLNPTHFTQSYNNMSFDQPAGWFMWVLAGLWVIVWILGFWLYFRIRRKHLPTQPESIEQGAASQPAE
jgi:hypothetical protein